MPFLVDVMIERVELYEALNGLTCPVAISMRCDGLDQTYMTPRRFPMEQIPFGCPVRLILNLRGLSGAHLRVMLHGCEANGYASLAGSQIRLENLEGGPGCPATYMFPLMRTGAPGIVAARVTFTISVSEVEVIAGKLVFVMPEPRRT